MLRFMDEPVLISFLKERKKPVALPLPHPTPLSYANYMVGSFQKRSLSAQQLVLRRASIQTSSPAHSLGLYGGGSGVGGARRQ